MSKLIEGSITIYEALQHIENGKYVMPAFQRQFVWNMQQIEKLWDSILLHYPIATFLFWHIDIENVESDTSFCNFLKDVSFNSRKESDTPNYDLVNVDVAITDTAILDGQQRLTSLFLSLLGDAYIRPIHARRKTGEKLFAKLLIELDENKCDIDEEEYNSKKHDIQFRSGKMSPTHFNIREIISDKFQNDSTRDAAIEEAVANVPPGSKDYARNILNTLHSKIFVEPLIRYTEILDMKQDDALEMFVRFNAGGRALRKHEITMSILEAYWSNAKIEFGRLLKNSYEGFGSDFIIRTALMLFGDVVKSNISRKVANELKDNWGKFNTTLSDLEKLLKDMSIDVSRFANNWNVLLPIIFFMYFNSEYGKNRSAIKAYLARAIIFTYFQSGTTSKLLRMRNNIIEYGNAITIEMLDNTNELRVTDVRLEDVLLAEKGSRVAGEVLYYLSLGWIDNEYKYDQDHLHPESRFSSSKPPSVTPENWLKWGSNRNRLPNLRLLEGRLNSSKNDRSLAGYYDDMNKEQRERFRETAIIPDGVSLEVEKFDEFYETRKKLLTQRIRELLG